jgi:hypothetical protein
MAGFDDRPKWKARETFLVETEFFIWGKARSRAVSGAPIDVIWFGVPKDEPSPRALAERAVEVFAGDEEPAFWATNNGPVATITWEKVGNS